MDILIFFSDIKKKKREERHKLVFLWNNPTVAERDFRKWLTEEGIVGLEILGIFSWNFFLN